MSACALQQTPISKQLGTNSFCRKPVHFQVLFCIDSCSRSCVLARCTVPSAIDIGHAWNRKLCLQGSDPCSNVRRYCSQGCHMSVAMETLWHSCSLNAPPLQPPLRELSPPPNASPAAAAASCGGQWGGNNSRSSPQERSWSSR